MRAGQNSAPETLGEFIDKVADHFSGSDLLICYRGQRDSSWKNVPGILRPEYQRLLVDEKRAIRKLMAVQPHEFAADQTMFDRLVRMQHFGLPTRLLDVTRNALVALYFASDPGPKGSKPTDGLVTVFAVPATREKEYDSDSVSCIANLANMTSEEKRQISHLRGELAEELIEDQDIIPFNESSVVRRLLQFVRAEKPYFQPVIDSTDLFTPYYVHPKLSNRRILAQSGAFILYGLLAPETMYPPSTFEETSFPVQQDAKKLVREGLDRIGINEGTLFPEIDRAASQIRESYFDEFQP